jgi:hypothetical protein
MPELDTYNLLFFGKFKVTCATQRHYNVVVMVLSSFGVYDVAVMCAPGDCLAVQTVRRRWFLSFHCATLLVYRSKKPTTSQDES